MHFLTHLLSYLPLMAMAAAPLLLFKPYRGISLNGAVATVNLAGQIFAAPQYGGAHGPLQVTWDYSFAGTAPATVNVQLQGTNVDNPQSAANSVWADADDGTTVGGEAARHVVNKEFTFWRVKVTVLTGGDATTKITSGIKFN